VAWLWFTNADETGFEWSARDLGNPWSSDSYQRIVLCTGSTPEGSSTAPSGIVDTVYPPIDSSGNHTPFRRIGGTAGNTYARNAYALTRSAGWWLVGWATITLPSPPNPRPDNSMYPSAKTVGVGINVTASEWNSFFTRINDFRRYKIPSQGNYGYTTVQSGNIIEAHLYRQAREAINAMSPPLSVPLSRGTGEIISASDINRLRDSLNSIT